MVVFFSDNINSPKLPHDWRREWGSLYIGDLFGVTFLLIPVCVRCCIFSSKAISVQTVYWLSAKLAGGCVILKSDSLSLSLFFGLGTELNYWVKTWLNALDSVLYFKRYYVPVFQRFRKSLDSILERLD